MAIKLSNKKKLLIPIFGLIFMLFFLGSIIISSYYYKIISLQKLQEKILLSNLISKTIHSLQKERGLSSGYVAKRGSNFKKDLILQRKKSDKAIKLLKSKLDSAKCYQSCNIFDNPQKKIFSKIDSLPLIRKNVDNYKISSKKVIELYSSINATLLKIIVDIAKSSQVPKITQDILSYSHFLYLKEYTGIERAQGVALLSDKKIGLQKLINFTNLIAVQKQNKEMFLQYASPKIKKVFFQNCKVKVFKQVSDMEQTIIRNIFFHTDINPKSWYEKITQKLDIYYKIGKHIEHCTTMDILKELSKAKNLFYFVIIILILSFIVFVFMVWALLKLIEQEQRLRVVMDKYVISSVTDLNGRIIDVSQAFCDISGYSREELIGKPHNIVRHPDTPKEVFKDMWSQIKSEKPWKGKIKNRKKDGGFYWVYANIEPLYNTKGVVDSYIAIRLDITKNELLNAKIKEEEEKRKKNEELMQQQYRLAQMGEMISMIAHQWRQPLSAITATTGAITLKAKLKKLDEKTAIELSDKIKNFSMHLSSTIDDFRNFFKPNKTKKVTDYKTLLDSVLLIAESSIKTNNIKLICNVGEIYRFDIYDNELKQVLLNLIKNAEDALIENKIEDPYIKIEIDKKNLIVKDNAGGIPSNIRNKIFDPYFSTKLKKDGTGLGLYMSKLIVEDHCGGKLMVHNDDKGAVFTIILEPYDDRS